MDKKIRFLIVFCILALAQLACSLSNGSVFDGAASSTAAPCPNCGAANPTVAPTAPTNLPAGVCVLMGGRQDDTKTKGYQYTAIAASNMLNDGLPLQEFFSQVVDTGFQKPSGLQIGFKHEILNDGAQWVYCAQYVFQIDDKADPKFWDVSYIVWNGSDTITIYHDDLGDHGSWTGKPAGTSRKITAMTFNQAMEDGDFAGRWQHAKGWVSISPFNQKVQVVEIYQ